MPQNGLWRVFTPDSFCLSRNERAAERPMGFGGKACQAGEDGYSQGFTMDCGDCSRHGEVRLYISSVPVRISRDLHNKGDVPVIVRSGGRKEALRTSKTMPTSGRQEGV